MRMPRKVEEDRDVPLAVRRMQLLPMPPVQDNSSGSSSGSTGSELSFHSHYPPSSSSESDSDGDIGIGINSDAFQINPEGQLRAALCRKMKHNGMMLLLFETPSGFALFSFWGGHCYLPDSVKNIWAKFADFVNSMWVVTQKGFVSFEDKSSAINADTGVDKKLVDLINDWHLPEMKLCVGKPEYKVIIESKLKIPCMYCQTALEIMWGIQYQMRELVPQEKSELTKEDRLMSEGLKNFLSRKGFDVKPEMVNEKIVQAASTLFECDANDKRNLYFLRDAGLHITDISGISCENWNILKLAIAVKVICRPHEELTGFPEVLAEDELSKLKGDALKYNGITGRSKWWSTCRETLSTYNLRIAKRKLLRSLVKESYEAEAQREMEPSTSKGRKRKWTTMLWDKEAYEAEAQREKEQSTSEGRKWKWTTMLWDWICPKPSTKNHKRQCCPTLAPKD